MSKALKIGDLLVSHGVLKPQDLDRALQTQKGTGRRLGEVLLEMELVTEKDIARTLSNQLALPLIDLAHTPLNREVALKIPEDKARRFQALPVSIEGGEILVAMVDPSDMNAMSALERQLGGQVQFGVIPATELQRALAEVYKDSQFNALVTELSDNMPVAGENIETLLAGVSEADAPAAKLLNAIFKEAVDFNASDIHIEPQSKGLLLRHRIDGVLRERTVNDTNISQPITSRLKLMAGLNIAEKRVPQDGRFSVMVKNRPLDVRMSTLPGVHGESVVMRLLNQSHAIMPLSQLGFSARIEKSLMSLLSLNQGMILTTGPTGSGKTTSLYSMINTLNTQERKIITAEDPVEYRIHRVTQVQVDDKVGLSFDAILRSALRQDPDVILVGEMRDKITAETGVKAAMTGHLVLSTLHTNDTISAVTRLIDMGVPYYLLATCISGILAQRLVRKNCPECSVLVTLSDAERRWVTSVMEMQDAPMRLMAGKGCHHCHQTGFQGRMPIHELLVPSKDALDALQQGDLKQFIGHCESQADFITLADAGVALASTGMTSLAEVMRITGDIDFHLRQLEKKQQALIEQGALS